MSENNNSNNHSNGGNISPSPNSKFANIRAAEERKLLARNNSNKMMDKNSNKHLTIVHMEEDEIDTGDKGSNSDKGSSGTASTPVDADHTDSVLLSNKNLKPKRSARRLLETIYTKYDVSKKSRLPLLVLIIICAVLFLTVIILAILWPYIPSYMKADVCIEQECLDSSKQILEWADSYQKPCDNPYKFVCGNFMNQYKDHELYLMNKGEWNSYSHFEYEDLNAAHQFITKLPSIRSSYIQPMIKDIFSNCMTVFSQTRDDENLKTIQQIIKSASGWHIFKDLHSQDSWRLSESLPMVHSLYGAWPFYKVSVQKQEITITEGELGLPDEQFYALRENHPIIVAYRVLMRDVYTSLVAKTTYDAETFVDNLYNYEKRIVNAVRKAKRNGTATSKFMRLYDLTTGAPSLPISETVRGIFKERKISDDTQVWVTNVEVFKELSTVVASTDANLLNDFVMWSLVRRFLPLMSVKYRSALENFHRKLYGSQYNDQPWHFCTHLTKEWMNFGLEALRQNPALVVVDPNKLQHVYNNDHYTEHLTVDKVNYNDDFIKMMFIHLRDEFKKAIDNADWIDKAPSNYINSKLSEIRIQMGIPDNVLRNQSYFKHYYNDFIFQNINFMENLRQHWNMEKKILGTLLQEKLSDDDRIVAEMFSTNAGNRKVRYIKDLNMVIVSRELLRKPYYHYKYPLALNFARIGTDLASILLEAAFVIGEEFKTNMYDQNQLLIQNDQEISGNNVEGDSLKCIESKLPKHNKLITIPTAAKMNLFSTMTAADLTQKALNALLARIKNNDVDNRDIELVKQLNLNKRQNGLIKYDHDALFSLIYLQKHCSVIDDEYKHVKVLVENKLPEREIFSLMWEKIPSLSESLKCSPTGDKCQHIL